MNVHETDRKLPVYSVGDSAFQASIINEKVPCEKRSKQKSVSHPYIYKETFNVANRINEIK